MSEKKRVELVFREPVIGEEAKEALYAVSPSVGDYMSKGLDIDSIQDYFLGLGNFTISEITLSLEAMVETGALTKLFVKSSGTGGITITLKPK